MKLGPHDLHVMLDGAARELTVWDAAHRQLLACETRNRTTADGQLGHDGNCPPGEFTLGTPLVKNTVPFGPWFVPVLDYGLNHTMETHGRSGIGIHGGGSGLASPFANRQGWQITHGCWRLQNEDLVALVALVQRAQRSRGACYATVLAPTPGFSEYGKVPADDDWAPVVELFPGE